MPSSRALFLRGFGGVWLCAFTSYYLQFPGLYGSDGLLPAGPAWRSSERVPFADRPSLLLFLGTEDDVDVALELISLVGVLVSACLLYTSPSPRDRG